MRPFGSCFETCPHVHNNLLVPALDWSSPKTSPTVVSLPQHSRLPAAQAVNTRAWPQIDGDGREIKS